MAHSSREKCPYPGPSPFEKNSQYPFFGRDREVNEILSLIISHRTLLLYAQSGAGKTSLINAGLIPLLEREELEVLPLARVRGLIPESMSPSSIPNPYAFNALISWAGDGIKPPDLLNLTLSRFLKDRQPCFDEDGFALGRVIIFDQFEELFSFYPERWKAREGFFQQVAEALAADPLLRVLFVMREDYLANMTPYAFLLPEQLRFRYQLECLGEQAAHEAVTGPLNNTRVKFDTGVAEKLVKELLTIRTTDSFNNMIETPGKYVEPVQLQVVCKSLWSNLPGDLSVITDDQLQKSGNVDEALKEFYVRVIGNTARKSRTSSDKLHTWFFERLITPSGTRGTVFREEEQTGGIPNSLVDTLESEHLIRAEVRAGARWYELTHDRLIKPIQEANKNLRKRLIRNRLWKRALTFAVFSFFLFMTILYFAKPIYNDRQREKRRHQETTGKIEKLREELPRLDKEERVLKQENTLNSIAGFLYGLSKRNKERLGDLVQILQQAEDLIPADYGADKRAGRIMPGVDANSPWPLTLKYNPDLVINQDQLRFEWWYYSANIAGRHGFPLPLRLKFLEDPSLPISEIRLFYDEEMKAGSRTGEKIFVKRTISKLKDRILFENKGLADPLKNFFDENKKNWSQLPELPGEWYLVPRWTSVLWKTAGYPFYMPEAALVQIVGNVLLNNPEYIFTRESVAFLVERIRKDFPHTVAEALAAQGGIEGIRAVMIECIKQKKSLTRLKYVLDSLARCPGYSPEDAARYAIADSESKGDDYTGRLPKRRDLPFQNESGKTEENRSGWIWIYEEAGPYIPLELPPINVYLAKNFSDHLKPEIIEAVSELRGKIYWKFGLDVPWIYFPTDDGLDEDSFSILMPNQEKDNPDAVPIKALPDRFIERLMSGLGQRIEAYRTRLITTEKAALILEAMPPELKTWLKKQFTLTDIKLILRSVISPEKDEREISLQAKSGDLAGVPSKSQTIRYPQWLFGSLLFWAAMGDDLDDLDTIKTRLRSLQEARVTPVAYELEDSKGLVFLKEGIAKLSGGSLTRATELFRKAVRNDREYAYRAFLKLYPQQFALTSKGRLENFRTKCSLPEPGQIASTNMAQDPWLIYELEEFIDQDTEILPLERRRLQLWLLWNYISANYGQKARHLIQELVSDDRETNLSLEEGYLLANFMIRHHGDRAGLPPYLDRIKALLLNACNGFDELKADDLLYELAKPYHDRGTVPKAPAWFASLLYELAQETIHSKGYWINYRAGEFLSDRSGKEDWIKAVDLLEKARRYIGRLPDDFKAQNAGWLDWKLARAYKHLSEDADPDEKAGLIEPAIGLLRTLADKIQPDKGWPACERIYYDLSEAYLIAGDRTRAHEVLQKGRESFPDSYDMKVLEYLLTLDQGQYEKAVMLAEDLMKSDNQNLFLWLKHKLFIQLVSLSGDYQYDARRFLYESYDDDRDYLRLLFHWALFKKGEKNEARELLQERWASIKPLGWPGRLESDAGHVMAEMLIGYFAGKVAYDEIFGHLKDPGTFAKSPYAKTDRSFKWFELLFFYHALFLDMNGDPDRAEDILRRVVQTHKIINFEYYMAKYLLENNNLHE